MAVHVYDKIHGQDIHLAPFTGNTNYDAVINGLLDVGFKGTFTLEAFSIPVPKTFCNRPPFLQKGPEYDRLTMLPLDLKMRSETLLLDIARYMLKTYNCLED